MRARCLLFVCLTLVPTARLVHSQLPAETAIDRYVHKEDAAYKWDIVSSQPIDGGKVVVVDMVSQEWLSKKEVDHPQWRHWLTLVIPEKPVSDIALLMIGGGKKRRVAANQRVAGDHAYSCHDRYGCGGTSNGPEPTAYLSQRWNTSERR